MFFAKTPKWIFFLLTLLLPHSAFGFFKKVQPTSCVRAAMDELQDPEPEKECPEATQVRQILPDLHSSEQLLGISTRDDRPNELYAIIAITNEDGSLARVVFQQYKKDKKTGTMARSTADKSRRIGSLGQLNRGGFKVHEETGSWLFFSGTRTVLHLRAMDPNETKESALKYNPAKFDSDDYEAAYTRRLKGEAWDSKGARPGDLHPREGGRLWLSYATDARNKDNVFDHGIELFVKSEVVKHPISGEETLRWMLAQDAEGKMVFDTLPLRVVKDGDDLNGVTAQSLERKLASILDGNKREGAPASQRSSDKSDAKIGGKQIEESKSPEPVKDGDAYEGS